MYKVSIRGGFSDRTGHENVNTNMQLETLDDRTRVFIFNELKKNINDVYVGYNGENDFANFIMTNVYTLETQPYIGKKDVIKAIRETVLGDSYHAVLSVVEYICRTIFSYSKTTTIFSDFDKLFEREYVGYRFVAGRITPIISTDEIDAIEESINNSEEIISGHFIKALEKMSDRESPDYENSIKESISAVEAMCNVIMGKEATLEESLKRIEQKIYIHPALKDSFRKLYAYTSDATGIRHAGKMDGEKATFEEAKFMLVSCSAFVNYLRGVSAN